MHQTGRSEIEKNSQFQSGDLQVCQHLRVVSITEGFQGLQFQDDLVLDHKVWLERAAKASS